MRPVEVTPWCCCEHRFVLRILAIAALLPCVSAEDPPRPFTGLQLALPGVGVTSVGDINVTVQAVAERPRVYKVDGLVSYEEAEQIVALAKQEDRFGSITGNHRRSGWRQSTQCWLRKDGEARPVVKALAARVARLLSVPLEAVQAGHPMQVLEYERGGRYFPHFDSRFVEKLLEYPDTPSKYASYTVHGGFPRAARAATLFCSLRNANLGGNTTFPFALSNGRGRPYPTAEQLDKMGSKNAGALEHWVDTLPGYCAGNASDGGAHVSLQRGSCVLFYNHLLTDTGKVAELDTRSYHAGCEVLKGRKWGINWWLEASPPFASMSHHPEAGHGEEL